MQPRARTEVDRSAVVFRDEGLVSATDGDTVLLLDRVDWRCHVLSPAAAVVWDAADGSVTVAALIESLAAETGLSADEVAASVETSLVELVGAGIVSLDGPRPATPLEFDADSTFLVVLDRPVDPIEPPAGERPGATVIGRFRLGPVVVRIGTDSTELAAQLQVILAPLALPLDDVVSPDTEHDVWILHSPDRTDAEFEVIFDGRWVRHAVPADWVLEFTLQELNLLATHAPDPSIRLHAGVVERDGDVIVVAGVSGRGKSTLVGALVGSGYAYLSDEMARIDPHTFAVHPYPKSLDLDGTALSLLGIAQPEPLGLDKFPIDPTTLGAVSDGGTVSMLVLLGPVTDPAGYEELTVVETLAELLPSVFVSTHVNAQNFEALVELCRGSQCVRLGRMEPAVAVALLGSLRSAAGGG